MLWSKFTSMSGFLAVRIYQIIFGILLMVGISFPILAQDDPIPVIDWQQRLTADDRLTAFGNDLMGDAIDTHLGSITFSHTDLSLPGNSNLDVSIRRKLKQGYKYDRNVNVEFGDWELDVPKIVAVTSGRYGWAGDRCSGSWGDNFPTVSWAARSGASSGPSAPGSTDTSGAIHNIGDWTHGFVEPNEYSNGVNLEVPGQGSQQVLKGVGPGVAQTVNEWYLTCTTADDGGEGFIAHAPNGDRYFFDKFINRPYKRLGTANRGPSDVSRQKSVFLATEVKDVHDNSVAYSYDSSNRLTRIESNDGREISLSYSEELISSVQANGRTWTYEYRDSEYSEREWGLRTYDSFAGKVLSVVTRPDNLSWTFNLDSMQAEPQPPTRDCYDLEYTMTMQHPNGTIGEFVIESAQHRQAYKSYTAVGRNCVDDYEREPDANGSSPLSGQGFASPFEVLTARTMSVTSKQLSGPNIETANWTFTYEEDDPCFGLPANDCDANSYTGPTRDIRQYVEASPAHDYVAEKGINYKFNSDEIYGEHDILDFTNRTTVTQPDGSVITYYHIWDFEEVFGGKEVLRIVSKDEEELERVETTYSQMGCNGEEAIHSTGAHRTSGRCSTPTVKTVQTRDGDNFTSESSYNLDRSSDDFSYGNPVEMKRSSNISTEPRITTIEYEHNESKWILGLPKILKINDRLTASYDYDPETGQKTHQYRFGAPFGAFDYHSDGTLKSITDPLGRKAEYSDWHRGNPKTILRQDGETETQEIDDKYNKL